MWNLGQGKAMKALVAALLTALLFAGACSGDAPDKGAGSTGGSTTGPQEGTLVSSTTGPEKTEPSPPEATLGAGPDSPGVVLRLEGDPRTTFAGICNVGGKGSVLVGRVPKRYTFDPEGQGLSCRIQKRDRGRGSLKVILIADNTTRSVQQTSARGGVITLSYRDD